MEFYIKYLLIFLCLISIGIAEVIFVVTSSFEITNLLGILIYLSTGIVSLFAYGSYCLYIHRGDLSKYFFKQITLEFAYGFSYLFAMLSSIIAIYAIIWGMPFFSENLTWSLLGASFTVNLITAMWEEVVFRGALQKVLSRIFKEIGFPFFMSVAVTLQAFVFLYAHLGSRWSQMIEQSIFIFCTGLIFGLFAVKTGALWSSIGAHLGTNMFQEIAFGVNVRPIDFHQGVLSTAGTHKPFVAGCILVITIVLVCAFTFRKKDRNP